MRAHSPSRTCPCLPHPVTQPTLRTERLVLRPFTSADAADVRRLADDPDVANNTLTIPHPYPEGQAESWIATHAPGFEQGRLAIFAVTAAEHGALLGAIGLSIEAAHARAELGYWLGREFWGRGLATEAARAVVAFGLEELRLERIGAGHFPHNPASGRVLEKAGLEREGVLRGFVRKGGERLDLVVFGVVRASSSP